MDTDEEIWKEIIDFPNYKISNLGRVIVIKTGLYKKFRLYNGYYYVNLSNKTKNVCNIVHRLVAIHFIPNPENKPQVNHKDRNKLNNCIENLEWVSQSENSIHAHKTKHLLEHKS